MPLPIGQSSFVGKKGPMEDSRGSLAEEDSSTAKVASSQKDMGGKVWVQLAWNFGYLY